MGLPEKGLDPERRSVPEERVAERPDPDRRVHRVAHVRVAALPGAPEPLRWVRNAIKTVQDKSSVEKTS